MPELSKHVPEKFGRYFEPFLGGGALFFHLAGARKPNEGGSWATLGDSNEELIVTYEMVRDKPYELIKTLSKYAGRYAMEGEKFYYEARGYCAKGMMHVERAARFIFLNRTCFNGLYRVNRRGLFNVPHGRHKNPMICDEVTILTASDALARTEILADDFETTVASTHKGDFVYFDPPYLPASPSADFTSYTPHGFGLADHERLRDVALRLKKKDVKVLLSNADVPLAHKLYSSGFEKRVVQARRSVNSKTDRRGTVGEFLIW